MSFKCELCELEFVQKCTLQRHVKTVHSSKQLKCELCELEFSRNDLLQRHVKTIHSSKQLKCELCDYVTQRKENLKRHHNSAHSKIKSQVIKRKAPDSDSNVNKRTKYYLYDELFNSDDEDDIILNQAYNAVSKQPEKKRYQ